MFKAILASSILTVLFSSLGAVAADGKWECTNGAAKREVSITTEAGKKAPCQVIYKKDMTAEAGQTLWSAANDSGFCESKAKGFVEKLTGLGWTCQ